MWLSWAQRCHHDRSGHLLENAADKWQAHRLPLEARVEVRGPLALGKAEHHSLDLAS